MENGILLINKEAGMTSHDVVNRVRKIMHTKKVGHAGTLDPDATGVLVLCINKATKALQFLTADEKEYIATMSLGTSTTTYDASGDVTSEKEFTGYHHLEEVLSSFIGKQKQVPPMYSAIKVNGKKLYEYAREGKKIEVEPRDIDNKEIELLKEEGHEITFRVKCSKGTYIRSLCVDLAKALGYPGHMKKLIRTQSGAFRIDDCITLSELEQGEYKIISLEEAFSSFDKIVVEDDSIVTTGKKIKSDIDHQVAVYSKSGALLAIYGPDGKGNLKSMRGLF